jgi:hypothetical protein
MTTNNGHDPGGKVLLPLPIWVKGSAVFGGSNDMYRYELSRVWDERLPVLLMIGMNPSTASPHYDDPTVAKGRRYAERWGYGTLLMGNAFAYRATDQKRLLEVGDPIGPENDRHLLSMADRADMILFAYGQPRKDLRHRGPQVAKMLATKHQPKVFVLELSQDGTPKHPLYLKGSLLPKAWSPFSKGEVI